MTDNIDARGLSCPQPMILTRNALKKAGCGEVVVCLDSMTQVQNCSRAAEQLGWQTNYEEKNETFVLTLTKRSGEQ